MIVEAVWNWGLVWGVSVLPPRWYYGPDGGCSGQIRGRSEKAQPMNDRERFDKFTERARKVMSLAQEEAQRFNHNYIGTEHLLLGLVRETDGVAARVLANLGVDLNNVRSAVEFIVGRGDRIVLGDIGLNPNAMKALELAVDEARRLNHHYIGTEHLLLGLVREGEDTAAEMLESLGVNLEKVRFQTIQVLSQGSNGRVVQDDSRSTQDGWSIPALSIARLTHIQAEMQNTFRISDRDSSESLDAAQGRAYSLARSIAELLAEIARLQQENGSLRGRQR
jgi:ATP-dependent Clp protease ATP-binding subunit ClpA